MERLQLEHSDVISVHNYDKPAEFETRKRPRMRQNLGFYLCGDTERLLHATNKVSVSADWRESRPRRTREP